jgi:non-specific serine/threonine protein kinase
MLARMDVRLPLLTGGPRDQPDRLRTMRDAIAWSYDLLPPEEQQLFRRLAVFHGGFTLQAATAVGRADDESIGQERVPVFADPVLEGIASLVDASLLRREEHEDEPRYRMLETIGEFGLERLAAHEDPDAARQAHAAYYIALAEEADPHLIAPGQEVWLERLKADHDNCRAALAWLEECGDAEASLRLAGALRNLWLLHSHYTEGRRRLERALTLAPQAATPWRARALTGLALLATYQGDHAEARRALSESLRLWRQVGDAAEVARLRLHIGTSAMIEGQPGLDHARRETQWALRAFQALGETSLVARPLASMALSNLGDIAGRQGKFAQAVALCTEALTAQRELGYTWGAAISLARLGDVAQQMGDAPRAAAAYRESLALSRSLWDDRIIVWALAGLARVAAAIQPVRAARLMGAVTQWIVLTGVTPRATSTLPDRDAIEQRARAELDEDVFAAARAAGAALTPQHAIDEALATADAITAATVAPGPTAPSVAGLTPRELEVLRLVAAGRSNREIAQMLFVSVSTVKRHLSTILAKLELPSRSAATAYAHTHHLV